MDYLTNIYANLERLRLTSEIAEHLATNCFTDEQREALEYTQGKIKITIEEQIERVYGSRYLLYNLKRTTSLFAQVLNDHSYLIDEIKTYQEKIKQMRDPANYVKSSKTSMKGSTCSSQKNHNEALNRHISVNDNYMTSSSSKYIRGMNAEPTELINNLDVLDDTDKLSTKLDTMKKTRFLSDDVTMDKFMGTQSDEIQVPKEVAISDNRSYHNESFSKTGDLVHNSNYSFNENRNLNKGDSKGKSATSNTSTVKADNDVVGESVYKAITVEIPRLRLMFWNKFAFLFVKSLPC